MYIQCDVVPKWVIQGNNNFLDINREKDTKQYFVVRCTDCTVLVSFSLATFPSIFAVSKDFGINASCLHIK